IINKCRALSVMFKHSTSTSSTDRLRRVQQQARFLSSEHDILSGETSLGDCDILLVNNPVASLLSCEDTIFLCIGEIIAIHVGPKSVDNLPLDVLREDTIWVTFQVYSLVCTPLDDDSAHGNDWCARERLPMKFKVPGSLVQPINPCVTTPQAPSHVPFYLFDTATLLSLTSSLCDRLTKPYLKLVPKTVRSHLYPYCERSGLACFVVKTLNEIGDSSAHECPACTPTVRLDSSNGQRILAHIGSHVLHDPSIDLSEEPCGLCLRPASLCSIYLIRRTGRNSQWTIKYSGNVRCPNATNFSYTVAMSSSKASPCSNVPLVCPYCLEGSPAIWRYNLRHHLRRRHHNIDPMKHTDLWKITPEETEAMAAIWKNRCTQPKRRRGKGKQKVPLKLSEAHSSRNFSEYVKHATIFILNL
ncbi:hypothetical protein EDB84DRAFT_1264270, partial [Lactarius hengduanensis]